MQLSISSLAAIDGNIVAKPTSLHLPEKILQFGTGVLLRGLCDFFVDRANRQGIFNGSIIVVKSTGAGDADAFAVQDNLYTICVRGVQNNTNVAENIICSAISRVISAKTEWNKVLDAVKQEDLKIIISNTTEVGLQLVQESIHQSPPSSYPAKLLAVLHKRYVHFKGRPDAGMIVVPTELITENGDKLRKIVDELAVFNGLDPAFRKWLGESVYFCNSLVDRIVTKDPGTDVLDQLQRELGYQDELLTMCEDYRLWAIQGNDHVQSTLSFIAGDAGVFVKPDIEIYKSLKLHLLNGTHTFSAALAYLAGFDTVKQAMDNERFYAFVENIMLGEIGSSIPFPVPSNEIIRFGRQVLDRFRNPFLRHQWLNITVQYSAKMRMRNVPVLKEYQQRKKNAPAGMSLGFAAYLLFMKATKKEGDNYFGSRHGEFYKINDDQAPFFYTLWQSSNDPAIIVDRVLSNTDLWGEDLRQLSFFQEAVKKSLMDLLSGSAKDSLYSLSW